MPLVAVGYVKSRPGASTVALGLAGALPASARAVLVECDPAGGDVAARFGLRLAPGLVELATAARSTGRAGGETAAAALSRCAQLARVGDRAVDVVAGPPGGAQNRVAVSVLTEVGRAVLAPPDRVVVADCGRWDASSAAWPLVSSADAVLVLTRGRLEEVAHLREHLGDLLDAAAGRLTVVLAPGGVYEAAEVAAHLDEYAAMTLGRADVTVRVVGPLPYDEQTAAALGGARVPARRWRRSPLMAALTALAGQLPVAYSPATPVEVGP